MPIVVRWFLNLLPTTPMVVRLVQGGSRRTRHLIIRASYLGVLIVVLLAMLLPSQAGVQNYRDLAAAGAHAFEIVAYLQLILICILSPVFMAGAIAQESSPRTWEILLTTPLSSLQMVLGVLSGRLFFVLALLAASLPLFAITQYFGGVPGRSVLLSYAVSGCAALTVGAVAVALAVTRLTGRRAVFAFYVAVVTYLAVTIAIDARMGPGVTYITSINPFLALKSLLAPSSYPKPDDIQLAAMGTMSRFMLGSPVGAWCSLSAGLSVFLIALSTITVRTIGRSPGGVPWYRRMFGLGAKDAGTRKARGVGMNPIAWREATARQGTLGKILARWSFIALGFLWGAGILIFFHSGGMAPKTFRSLLLTTVWTEIAVILLIAVNVSATAISREREDGTLDLLLTTPITQKEYLYGKLRGLVTFLLPLLSVPLGMLLLACIYVLFDGFGAPSSQIMLSVTSSSSARAITVPVVLSETGLLMPIVTIPFMALAVMVGLQWSLRSKGTIASVIGAVGVLGSTAGVCGLIGWKAGEAIPFLGSVAVAMNPVTLIYAACFPEDAVAGSLAGGAPLGPARFSLGVGAVIAAAAYVGLVFAILSSMVKTFDVTTRKLAGSA